MLLLIDADPIVYRCGFAAEQTSWHIVYETDKGEADEIEFSPDEDSSAGEKMREWLAFNDGRIAVLDKSRVVRPDPVSYALRATKVQIESIITECEAKYGPCKMLMWLSGKGGSYRDRIATVRPYKGNRDPTHKPYHYDAIRDYLRSEYGSFVTHGIEADDAVSIYAHKLIETGGESYVVCTIDKDLDQIPGEHYNYMNKVFYAITNQESERWFIYQLLAGDTTDNIVGVWKCGPKQADAILRCIHIEHSSSSPAATGDAAVSTERRQLRIPGDTGRDRTYPGSDGGNSYSSESGDAGARSGGMDGGDGTIAELDGSSADRQSGESFRPSSLRKSILYPWWETVVRAYADSQRRPGCPYAQDNPEAVAIEMAQLVKLQEYPGQLWHPHGDLVVPGFGEENFDG